MSEAAELFAASDTVALPYPVASQSGVLLLAYGFHRPVVVYPVGGMAEAVIDGETGWVCAAPTQTRSRRARAARSSRPAGVPAARRGRRAAGRRALRVAGDRAPHRRALHGGAGRCLSIWPHGDPVGCRARRQRDGDAESSATYAARDAGSPAPEPRAMKRAIILAGGKGTRLRPYTTVLPKPLMPIGDRPILDIVVRQLKAHGFERITIATGHLAELIEAFFRDGESYGIADRLLPRGRAARHGRRAGADRGPRRGTVLVMNGDILTDLDYGGCLEPRRAAPRDDRDARHVQISLGVLRFATMATPRASPTTTRSPRSTTRRAWASTASRRGRAKTSSRASASTSPTSSCD